MARPLKFRDFRFSDWNQATVIAAFCLLELLRNNPNTIRAGLSAHGSGLADRWRYWATVFVLIPLVVFSVSGLAVMTMNFFRSAAVRERPRLRWYTWGLVFLTATAGFLRAKGLEAGEILAQVSWLIVVFAFPIINVHGARARKSNAETWLLPNGQTSSRPPRLP